MMVGNRRFTCGNGLEQHGRLALSDAISESCDIYFYTVGLKTSAEVIAAEARRFRLDRPTGIDLPGETRRMLIPDPQWKKRARDENWTPGDTANMAIGQGDVQMTPLVMACFAASFARGELWTVPTLLHDPGRPAQHTEPIGLSPYQRAAILKGMEGATMGEGTAAYPDEPRRPARARASGSPARRARPRSRGPRARSTRPGSSALRRSRTRRSRWPSRSRATCPGRPSRAGATRCRSPRRSSRSTSRRGGAAPARTRRLPGLPEDVRGPGPGVGAGPKRRRCRSATSAAGPPSRTSQRPASRLTGSTLLARPRHDNARPARRENPPGRPPPRPRLPTSRASRAPSHGPWNHSFTARAARTIRGLEPLARVVRRAPDGL